MAEVVQDDLIYVAVGKNVEESRLNLIWVIQGLQAKKLCLLHVHQPTDMTPSSSGLEANEIEAIQEMECCSMYESLHEHISVCQLEGMNMQDIDISCIYMNDIGVGIVEHIYVTNIKKLVMGAAADAHYTEGMDRLKSRKSEYVSEHAPQSCQIWFVCKGNLVLTAERQSDRVDETEPDRESSVSSSLTSSSLADTGFSLMPLPFNVTPLSEDNSERRTDDPFCTQLEKSIADAEKFRRESFDESIKRFEAEKNAVEAIRKSREYEALYREELKLRMETERNLLEEKEGHERAKIERDEAISRCRDAQRLQEEELRSRREAEIKFENLKQVKEHLNNALEETLSNLTDCQLLIEYYKNEQDRVQGERDEAIRGMDELLKAIADDDDDDSGSDQPPSYFLCPISQEIMKEPQFAADGFTYEAEKVKEWFERGNNTSPMTNLELQHLHLVPNLALRSAIQEWLQSHPHSS